MGIGFRGIFNPDDEKVAGTSSVDPLNHNPHLVQLNCTSEHTGTQDYPVVSKGEGESPALGLSDIRQ